MATTNQTKKTAVKKSAKTASKKVTAASKATESSVSASVSSVIETLKANFDNVQENSQRAWLASLGLVGVSVDEIKVRYERINEDSQGLLKDLVVRGEKVQSETSDRLKDSRVNFEEQIETAKDRITSLRSEIDLPARLQDVSDKLESLSQRWKKSA